MNAKDIKPRDFHLEHRHFVFIAQTLAGMRHNIDIDDKAWREVCRDMCRACAATNPRFDGKRFLAACGINE